jgi:hypothetical protein
MDLEVSKTGEVVLPAEVVQSPPHTRVSVERHGNTVVLKFCDDHSGLATDSAHGLTRLLRWAERNQTQTYITPDTLRRENLYD